MIAIVPEPVYYNVQFLLPLNGVRKGTVKSVMILPMLGRIYSPDKDENGKYVDKVGVKDNRVMVMGIYDYLNNNYDYFYWVAKDMETVQHTLQEMPVAVEEV